MTRDLEQLGAEVICLPTIEIIAPADWSPLDLAIDRIAEFDWIIFTSANAVRFVCQRIGERGLSLARISSRLRVFAIGPATAASLESESRPPDLVAPDSKGEGVLSCLIAALGGEQAIAGLKILIPRAAVAREFLPSELVRLGAKVDIIEVYRTVIPDVSSDDIVKLFQNRKVDVIVFTSSSTVTNLAALIEPADLRSLLKEVAVACIGPVTAATASEKGLRVDIRPDSYTGAALVQAISNYFPA